MAALTNTQISVTYVGLLKTSANTVLSATAQQITDGSGNNTIMYLSTAGVGIGGSPTAGKELDVTGNVLITGDLQVDNININGNTISATSGVVTLQDGTIATTQSQSDNSTKVATTAYVDAAVTAEDLDFAGDSGTGAVDLDSQTFTIAGTSNEIETSASGQTLTIGLPDDVTIGNDLTVTTDLDVGGLITVGTNNTILQNDKLIFKSTTGAAIGHNTAGTAIQFFTTNTTALDTLALTISGANATVSGNLSVSGTGSFTGQVTIPATPSASTDAASKGYVDSQVGANNELSEVLANGNTTGGTDIAVSSGDNITFADSSQAIFGAGSDLKIFSDGSGGYIRGLTAIQSQDGTDDFLSTAANAGVSLFYNNSKKFETTSAGVTVTGDVLIGTSTTTPSTHYNNLVIEDVAGNNVGISLISGTGNNTALYFGDSDDTDIGQIKYSHSSNDMFFVTNATTALTIDSSQNATFAGTISSGAITSSASITASGNSNSFGNTTITALSATSGTFSGSVTAAGNSNSFGATTFSGTISSGDITIEDTNPNLTLSDTSTTNLIHEIKSSSDNLRFSADTNNVDAGTKIEFYTDGVERLEIEDDGQVNIISAGTVTNPCLTIGDDVNTGIWRPASDTFAISTGGNERMRISSNGSIYNSTSNPVYENTYYGHDAGRSITSGTSNTFLGSEAGEDNTSGAANTFVGAIAGYETTTGSHNTALGYFAFKSNVSGGSNVALGSNSLKNNTSGIRNIAIGYDALASYTTGQSAIAIGFNAGYSLVSATGQIAIGQDALYTNSGGVTNTSIGHRSLTNATSNYNTAFGYETGLNTTTGSSNTFIGLQTGYHNSTGSNLVAIGESAGFRFTTGSNNVGIGSQVGTANNVTGDNNTSVGHSSGRYLNTGNSNSFFGAYAGENTSTGTHNTFIGLTAGQSNTSGVYNTIVGASAGDAITNGSRNTLMGYTAGGAITTASDNVVIGSAAGANISTGNYNTIVGKDSGNAVTNGQYNTTLGYQSALRITGGNQHVCIGYLAGQSLVTGNYSVLVGAGAGNSFTQTGMTAIGFNAGYGRDSTGYETFVGYQSGYNSGTGGANVGVGFRALFSNTSSDSNTAIGYSALQNQSTGVANTAIGRSAGLNHTTGGSNVFLGAYSSISSTTAQSNIAIGYSALRNNQTASINIAIGYEAMYHNTGGVYNVVIGYQALYYNPSNSHNVMVGLYAGHHARGERNTYMGSEVGFGASNTSTGNNNSLYGFQAGYNLTTGSTNTLLGYQSGYYMSTGYENTALGKSALGACSTGAGNIGIGVSAGYNMGSGGSNIAIGYAAMNGTSAISGTHNTVVGDAAGYYLSSGGNNLLLGKNAGRSTSPSGQLSTHSNIVCLGDNSITDLYCADTTISSSDARDKTDIEDFNIGLDFVTQLQPKTYKWDKRAWYINPDNEDEDLLDVVPDGSKKAERVNVGMLAQDVLELEKQYGYGNDRNDMLFVGQTPDEKSYGLKYERLVPVLINAIKELKQEIEILKSK